MKTILKATKEKEEMLYERNGLSRWEEPQRRDRTEAGWGQDSELSPLTRLIPILGPLLLIASPLCTHASL